MRRLSVIGLLLLGLLTGCVVAVVAGSAAGAVVYDGRGVKVLERDTRIFHLIHTAIVSDARFRHSNIEVTSFDQVVLLVGQTPKASFKVLAENIAKNTPHVLRVYNEITVGESISLGVQSKDVWITSQVRSFMLLRKGLASGSIRVVTEDGAVYLMGTVTKEQAYYAVDVARKVKDVKRVVKVFTYVNLVEE